MQLDKENMKKIRWLIAFAVLLYLGVQNLDIIINTAQVLLGFLFPFIVGFGIAFILKVPMKFIEHHLWESSEAGEKICQETGASCQSDTCHLFCDLPCRDCYACGSAGACCDVCEYRKENRRKYSGIPEMAR